VHSPYPPVPELLNPWPLVFLSVDDPLHVVLKSSVCSVFVLYRLTVMVHPVVYVCSLRYPYAVYGVGNYPSEIPRSGTVTDLVFLGFWGFVVIVLSIKQYIAVLSLVLHHHFCILLFLTVLLFSSY
jgi:hypothetical protein